MSEPLWVYSNAIRHLGRIHGLSFRQTKERFGPRLTHVQCNVVTVASVRACERGEES